MTSQNKNGRPIGGTLIFSSTGTNGSQAHDDDSEQQQSGTVVGLTALNLLATLTEFFTLCRVVF